MLINGVKIRSFGVGCAHEIRLPNGKNILIDPYFGEEEAAGAGKGDAGAGKPERAGRSVSDGRTRHEIASADYILITHTHFDHDLAAGSLAAKFGSKVFVGAQSAMDFLKFHRLAYDNVFPVYPGQTYTLEDFSFRTWTAKHNPSGGRTWHPEDDICRSETGITGHQACDTWGSLESLDYMISTDNNIRILVASGRIVWDGLLADCRQLRPNILIRQAGMRKTGEDLFGGGQVPAEELARIFVQYHAQLVIPFHYDVLVRREGEAWVSRYFEDVKQEMERLKPGISLLYPRAWQWYNVGMSIETES